MKADDNPQTAGLSAQRFIEGRPIMTTAAAGWMKSGRTRRPRKTSDAALAKDIAASIRAHAEAGVIKSATDYTSRVEVIERVESLLS